MLHGQLSERVLRHGQHPAIPDGDVETVGSVDELIPFQGLQNFAFPGHEAPEAVQCFDPSRSPGSYRSAAES